MHRREGEIGCLIANLCGHITTFYEFWLKHLYKTFSWPRPGLERNADEIITYNSSAGHSPAQLPCGEHDILPGSRDGVKVKQLWK